MAVTIHDALKNAEKQLQESHSQSPLLDAEVILCEVTGIDRLHLVIDREKELTDDQVARYARMTKKRVEGMPVAYIIGRQEFMGLDFSVKEGVLIPRPDTEILVEAVIEWAEKESIRIDLFEPLIADLGTGSGAITVALAKYIPGAVVYSIDVEDTPLHIGRINAEKHEVSDRIRFIKGDMLKPFDEEALHKKFDAIVSNPPYITTQDLERLQIEVQKYEPHSALDGGEDGLDYYRVIVPEAPDYIRPGGILALEVGFDQADEVVLMMEQTGKYDQIRKIRDLAGIQRVVFARIK